MRSTRNVYIMAGVISILLYAFGVATGIYVQRSVLSIVETDIESLRQNVENAQQESVLFGLRGKESCTVLSPLSVDINQKITNLANELIALEEKGEKGAHFIELKRVYGSLSIRAWILRSSINANCDENVLPILYYYSVPCATCLEQGKTIDNITAEGFSGKLAVYVVDKDIDHPLVKTVVRSHSVSRAPSLVIEKDVYQGFMNKGNLTDILCQKINATACEARNRTGF